MVDRMARAGLGTLLLFLMTANVAEAIPAFARKYRVSCSLCHGPAPRLTEFGEAFAANGFEFQAGEEPRDTIETGDGLLRLQDGLPLAVRFDAYVQALSEAPAGGAAVDLATPWGIKLLTGGQISDRISYYMYFFMSEHGDVAGLEDAYVQFTDVFGTDVAVMAGQFQVSDPLFKRELRLEFEDYNAYRVRVGDARADLTYDRGVMVTRGLWAGADAVVGIVNGTGLSGTTGRKQYDIDSWKGMFVRLSQDLGALRVGGYGYFNDEERSDVVDDIMVYGPDATVELGRIGQLNVQLLRRTDSNPEFAVVRPTGDVTTDMGFAELLIWPDGPAGRLFLTGLYNRVDGDGTVPFGIRQGEAAPLDRYEYAAGGVHYLLARNVRVMAEAGWDFEAERARFTVGAVTAF